MTNMTGCRISKVWIKTGCLIDFVEYMSSIGDLRGFYLLDGRVFWGETVTHNNIQYSHIDNRPKTG